MNFEKMIEHHNEFQHTDFGDDLIGISFALANWMAEIRQQLPSEALPNPQTPDKFFKIGPHYPAMKYRMNIRKLLAYALSQPKDELFLPNLYTALCAAGYVYHLPVELFHQAAPQDREETKHILLEDGMSPNCITEPNMKDHTALYLKVVQ